MISINLSKAQHKAYHEYDTRLTASFSIKNSINSIFSSFSFTKSYSITNTWDEKDGLPFEEKMNQQTTKLTSHFEESTLLKERSRENLEGVRLGF